MVDNYWAGEKSPVKIAIHFHGSSKSFMFVHRLLDVFMALLKLEMFNKIRFYWGIIKQIIEGNNLKHSNNNDYDDATTTKSV